MALKAFLFFVSTVSWLVGNGCAQVSLNYTAESAVLKV